MCVIITATNITNRNIGKTIRSMVRPRSMSMGTLRLANIVFPQIYDYLHKTIMEHFLDSAGSQNKQL